MRHIDRERARLAEFDEQREARERDVFRVVDFVVNGIHVPFQFNLSQMRNALGLPDYELVPVFRPPVAGSAPETNINDVDHEYSDDDMEE